MIKKGDRIQLNQERLREVYGINHAWQEFDWGTAIRDEVADRSGYGSDHPESSGTNVGVRWDGYDYGPSESNCHSVDPAVLTTEPDEDELNEILASIGQAARKTTST